MNYTYIFGECRLELGPRELWRNGARVDVTKKQFDVLLLLIEQQGNAVGKDAIVQRGWRPDKFPSDASVANVIARLRRALGDSEVDPRYIETKTKFGYMFIAKVEKIETPGTPRTDRPARRKRFLLIAPDERCSLSEGVTTLGRCSASPLWFESTAVSRQHAQLTNDGDTLEIVDLKSRNGTFVNNKRISQPTRLRHGDKVRLAKVQFLVRDTRGHGEKTTDTLPTNSGTGA